jgi:hypothetical protein
MMMKAMEGIEIDLHHCALDKRHCTSIPRHKQYIYLKKFITSNALEMLSRMLHSVVSEKISKYKHEALKLCSAAVLELHAC